MCSGPQGYGGPCEQQSCGLGRHCVAAPGGGPATCGCLERCRPHYKPVCGSDGTLYRNHCELHRTACLTHAHITITHSQDCFYKGEIRLSALSLSPSRGPGRREGEERRKRRERERRERERREKREERGEESEHFIKGNNCDDPLSPDWVPSIFSHIPATKKRKREKDMERCWTCTTCCG
ncbi:unnamed protein product [Boreogadus saida]